MLHHGDVAAVWRCFLVAGVAFGDVFEFNLLVFLFGRVEGRAGEGGIKAGLARFLAAIAHQLNVELGRNGLLAAVDDFVRSVDDVGAALQRVGFYKPDAANFGRFKAQGEGVFAVLERALAAELHDGFVRGQRRALRVGQAGLGLVDALAAVVQQHEGFAGAARLVIRQKFAVDDGAAPGIEHELHHVGGDFDALAGRLQGGWRGLAGQKRRSAGCARGRRHG